jgi:hypothetical protein
LRYLQILIGAPLLSGVFGCPDDTGHPGASARATPLTLDSVRALLYRCEAAAQQGDVPGFRACLTAGSAARLDEAFAEIAEILGRVASTEGAAATPTTRQALASLRQEASWPAQLERIARGVRSPVAALEQRGDRASFLKRTDGGESRHFLRRVQGGWRIDLEANPQFAERLAALRARVLAAASRLGQGAGPAVHEGPR